MKDNQTNVLIRLCENLPLFHDQYGIGFAFLNNEDIPLRSKKIRRYLANLMWIKHEKSPSSGVLSQAIDALEARAAFDNPKVFLFNRVGKGPQGNDSFFYDLANGKVVRITPKGWDVVIAPILFRRYPHQKGQVTPVKGGDPRDLFQFVNVESEYRLLILVQLISCFIPDISHPHIYTFGDHGAGKTTACMMVKDIIDPSFVEKQSIPRDRNELIQVLVHHYFPVFDNLSSLPDWASDILSQASTGGGLSKRQLYTDDEDIFYQFRRPVALNGINVVIHKPDLMDRSILFSLDRISPQKRKTEQDIQEEFSRLKPAILGGIFDALSKAMTIYPQVQLSWTPRMADFGTWGFAIAEALEKGMGEKFLEAYRKNIDRQIEEVVQTNALAESVLNLMGDKSQWKTTIGNAWNLLYKAAGKPKSDPTFPRSQRTLRKHLGTIRASLQHYGIFYKIYPRTKNGYPIMFTRDAGKFDSFGSPPELLNQNKALRGEPKGEAKERKCEKAKTRSSTRSKRC